MKRLFAAICIFLLLSPTLLAQSTETFHDFSALTILGDTLNLSDYYGKKVLVVNTASFCSYTPQYADLQALDSIYSSYNFEVIGFPCNDFGGQEPGSDSAINTFCTGTYGVTFQMMSKVSITAWDTAEVYKWLQLQSRNGVADAPVVWNFNKFLIDEAGHWVNHFTQQTSPFDTAITNWIMTPSVLAVNNFFQAPEIKILKNPVEDILSVSISNAGQRNLSVKLFSIQGSHLDDIFSGIMKSNTPITYNCSQLKSGIYLLLVSGGEYEKTSRIAIAR